MTDSPESKFSTPRVAAGVLFTDAVQQILLLRPTYKSYWDIPGGYVEQGETPLAAAAREVQEEVGLSVSVSPLLVVDWAPHPEEGDKLLFVFDGGQLDRGQLEQIRFADGEIAEWTFIGKDRLEQLTISRLARRLRYALSVRGRDQALYLQDGELPM